MHRMTSQEVTLFTQRCLLANKRISVANALLYFANVTLSSLYLDITKDCLYANARESVERQAVVSVLERVC